MSALTEVELTWIEGQVERWIRFGHVAEERVIDRRRRVLAFAPGAVFAFVRWESNGYGTVTSHIDILRAVSPGDACTTVPCVSPGGEVLLRATSWPKVEQVLRAIDVVDALGINPADADPSHWCHVHNRLAAGVPTRTYTRPQHRAWLLRQRVNA